MGCSTFSRTRALLGLLGVFCLSSSAAAYTLAPISGRLISHAANREASKHKLVIRLDCVKSSFGSPKNCGTSSAEVVIGPDGAFQTPALEVSGFFPTQYNAGFELIHADSPNDPVVKMSYAGIDNDSGRARSDDRAALFKDLSLISIYDIPRIQLVFSLKSGGSVENFVRGPLFRDRFGLLPFWVDAQYKIGGKASGMGDRKESSETRERRRALDQYFVGGEVIYAPGVDAPVRELSVDLFSYLGETALIDQACPAVSPCRVMINDMSVPKP